MAAVVSLVTEGLKHRQHEVVNKIKVLIQRLKYSIDNKINTVFQKSIRKQAINR